MSKIYAVCDCQPEQIVIPDQPIPHVPLSELIEEWLKEHPEAPIPEYVRDGEK